MVRISRRLLKSKTFTPTFVYLYLKYKDRDPGVSIREISYEITEAFNLSVGPFLKREIAAALRRGIDYGIVKKISNKYSFDADSIAVLNWRQEIAVRNRKKSRKTAAPKRQPVPRPRVPKPPSFQERKRNLREEPMPRIRKHEEENLPDGINEPEKSGLSFKNYIL